MKCLKHNCNTIVLSGDLDHDFSKHLNKFWKHTFGNGAIAMVRNIRHSGASCYKPHFVFQRFSLVFRAQEPKAPVTYCDHALSGVRPSSVVWRLSSVRLFTFSTSSPEPLDGFWWNLVWMKYSRSLTSVVVFRPDPSRGGSRAGQK